MSADPKRGLGRGLSALLGDGAAKPAAPGRSQRHLPIGQLEPSPLQPRRRFDAGELESLAESIRSNGILQPILVRPHPGRPGMHEIVAGERRWRAAQIAKLHEVPVLERALSDREVLELAIVENVQRNDLSALEEAQGYRRLIDEFGRSQEELAQQVGKSRAHIANTLRLLKLPDSVRAMLEEGQLTAGHGRALLAAADPEALAKRVVAQGLSVRQTEALAARPRPEARAASPAPAKDADTRALEHDLGRALGLKVEIEHGRSGAERNGGRLVIRYRSLEQLDEVIRRLNREG
jgi:ParB family chromosome partitioning protein